VATFLSLSLSNQFFLRSPNNLHVSYFHNFQILIFAKVLLAIKCECWSFGVHMAAWARNGGEARKSGAGCVADSLAECRGGGCIWGTFIAPTTHQTPANFPRHFPAFGLAIM